MRYENPGVMTVTLSELLARSGPARAALYPAPDPGPEFGQSGLPSLSHP